MKHPQEVVTDEGVLHIRDVQLHKMTRNMEERLEPVEQEIFKCKGMVERGLITNHSMITTFMRENKVGGRHLENIILKLNDRIYYLQDQIYDFQRQNYEF
ncbi:40S ribosomal protein S5-1 [Hordeum vulgare]|nr:40S ribosomal protein S5-1 [Hordeum vulgare]